MVEEINTPIKVILAFEHGSVAYTGWAYDLEDGTCKLAVSPLLGEGSPKLGDRVDLFYHPCSPLDLPFIGYRVYEEGEEPVGRHFA